MTTLNELDAEFNATIRLAGKHIREFKDISENTGEFRSASKVLMNKTVNLQ
jgi:hypothetical protein